MQPDEKPLGNAAEAIGKDLRDTMEKDPEKFIKMFAEKGMPIKELLGFSDELIEGMYAQAYNLYNSGKYSEALSIFRMLIILAPQDGKHSMGVAACLHQMKEYRKAAEAYMMAGLIDPENPIPQFHASDCYIQMNDTLSAIVALEMAIELAGARPEYQIMADRAKLTLKSLREELKVHE